jgi:hypothetical protein
MRVVKSGRHHILPPDYEQTGEATAEMCAVRASRARLKLFDYEEALQVDPSVDKLIQLAQIAARGSNPYVLEDGPELLKVPGQHAEVGGEVLEGMCADRCTNVEESRISGRSGMAGMAGRAGGQVSAARVRSGPAGIISKDPRIGPT